MDSSNSIIILKAGNATAHIDLQKGGKLRLLILCDKKDNQHTIIQDDTQNDDDFLGNGSFIMYPYPGRLQSPEIDFGSKKIKIDPLYKDGKGAPIHGLIANTKRTLVKSTENSIIMKAFIPDEQTQNNFPIVSEHFTLEKSKFIVITQFENISLETQYFGYGYHPYLSLDGKSINDLRIKHNLTCNIPLNPSTLLPDVDEENNLQKREIGSLLKQDEVIGAQNYDNLFYFEYKEDSNKPYVALIDDINKIGVEVMSINKADEGFDTIALNYYQIYTPNHRKTICFEPQTSPGNCFFINFPKYVCQVGSGKKAQGQYQISLIDI